MEKLITKLEAVVDRYNEIGKLIIDPDVIADQRRYVQLTKEYNNLEDLVKAYEDYKYILDNIKSSKEMLQQESDPEFKEMAEEELQSFQERKEKMEEQIKWMLVPKDPEDEKNAIMEIRAGTGGDEAAIFAGDLYRMYTRYCETKGWKVELVSASEGSAGGFKEIILNVSGKKPFGTLKYEAGVHRVQRVPQTETQGRVHTSTATVMVLPEAEEFDVEVKESDLRVDSYCSSGPGGQSVNTTYSAIRITHIPTGVVAQCQDQKSKLKNYDKALSVLRSRIYEMELRKKQEEDAARRKTMVASGERSEKIRTYNYPQGRVTDHRINLTVYNLQDIMDGDLEEIAESLQVAENAEKLKAGMEED